MGLDSSARQTYVKAVNDHRRVRDNALHGCRTQFRASQAEEFESAVMASRLWPGVGAAVDRAAGGGDTRCAGTARSLFMPTKPDLRSSAWGRRVLAVQWRVPNVAAEHPLTGSPSHGFDSAWP